jgi:hypothetical protein
LLTAYQKSNESRFSIISHRSVGPGGQLLLLQQ